MRKRKKYFKSWMKSEKMLSRKRKQQGQMMFQRKRKRRVLWMKKKCLMWRSIALLEWLK